MYKRVVRHMNTKIYNSFGRRDDGTHQMLSIAREIVEAEGWRFRKLWFAKRLAQSIRHLLSLSLSQSRRFLYESLRSHSRFLHYQSWSLVEYICQILFKYSNYL